MLIHSEGIVIKTTRYSETTVIAKIYTREKGMLSFYIPGVYGKKPAVKPSYLQPLQVLDMNFYFHHNKNLLRIKEARISFILNNIHFDVKKSSVAVFISEIIYKTIKEEEENQELFGYLLNSIRQIDEPGRNLFLFPLIFMIQYSKYAGFFPDNNYDEENRYFNIHEGKFISLFPGYENGLDDEQSQLFSSLIQISSEKAELPAVSVKLKNELLTKIFLYYGIHVAGFGNVKTYDVLTALFNKNG